MPMLISVDPTTRSMTRNGRKIRKPIWNAVLSSEIVKAGIRTVRRDVLARLGLLELRELGEQREVLVRVWLNMNSRIGSSARLSARPA